jgi:hypothetical protein
MSYELSTWVCPDNVVLNDLDDCTNLNQACFEFLRFHMNGDVAEQTVRGATVREQSRNNEGALDSSNVYVLGLDWFGGVVYSANNARIIREKVPNPYVTVSGRIDSGVMVMLKEGEDSMKRTINAIVKFTKDIGFAGVDLNVEGIAVFGSDPSYIPVYTKWCNDLGDALHAQNLKFRFVTVPEGAHMSSPWKNEYIKDIKSADYVVAMAYDLQADEGKTAVVTNDFARKTVEKLINHDGIPVEKIILGIANYGYVACNDNVWRTKLVYRAEAVRTYGLLNNTFRDLASGELYSDVDVQLDRRSPAKPGYMFFSDQTALMQQVKVGQELGVNKFCMWVLGTGHDWFNTKQMGSTTVPTPVPAPVPVVQEPIPAPVPIVVPAPVPQEPTPVPVPVVQEPVPVPAPTPVPVPAPTPVPVPVPVVQAPVPSPEIISGCMRIDNVQNLTDTKVKQIINYIKKITKYNEVDVSVTYKYN